MIAPATAPWAAASRSASSNTTNGALPPSSRCTRLAVSAASAMIRRPTAVEPVKEVMATSGWRTRCLADDRAGAGDDVDDAVREAGGGSGLGEQQGGARGELAGLEHDRVAGGDRRAGSSTRPSAAGSSTARWTRRRRRARGAPSMCRRPPYSPAARPWSWRAAPAKKDALSTVPGTSNSVDMRMVLPVCAVSSSASSAERLSSSAARRSSAVGPFARRAGGTTPATRRWRQRRRRRRLRRRRSGASPPRRRWPD